ncbi:Oligopeptidase A [Calidithermus terrae]|uniref:oligopeptidase A n=1 Tax=Calidithermus terrae TaxID=1408545 RepID=A0A399ER17_9DEIN|nr:M3 family metallopeptidase [Calidithermus terrae]RIH85002.1 Oligopeptidase A [Calidithermus terrae]
MAQNPLLDLGFDIPFEQIKPEHVEPAIRALIAGAEQEFQAILDVPGERTYANTLGAYDRLGERLQRAFRVVSHLESVRTTPELRQAYNATLPLVTAFYTKVQLSSELYAALKAYAATPEAQRLSPTKRRFLQLTLDAFRREGADLPPEKKARLEAINTRLAELTSKYSQNVLDSTAAFELYLEEPQLAGLPDSARQAARQSAQAKGREGYRFTLQAPSYLALMTYLDDASVREQVYRAYNNRATEEGRDNRQLLPEILALRQEKAELLGYAHFADLVLEERMAKNGATAVAFERDLAERYRPYFERENQELQAFRQRLEGPDAPPLAPWDVAYYAEKQRQAVYDFDEEALRPYFPLPQVLEGLFELCRRVFGIRVEPAEARGWHPDVRSYDLYDPQGRFTSRFYTDWFPRDDKRGGAWMNFFITGNRDGASEPHLTLMCGNLTPPVGDQPALLTHREVETIFHEFGHLLHHALSNVEVLSLAGTNVPWDFVELPSQIMENWCWEREALDLFARHYRTGEPIPDPLFQRMRQARTYRAANATMRQLAFGTVDLALHIDYKPHDGDVAQYARTVMEGFSPAPLPEDYAFIASFGHLFGSSVGYAAGYYSYKWAEVLDADAFSRFQAEGIFNPDTGRDFVEHILTKGNSDDPAQLFRNFMGRDPSPEALLRRTGLLD